MPENKGGHENPTPIPGPAPAPAKSRPRPMNSLQSVRLEMAAVYREARAGRIEPKDAAKLVYILMQIKNVLESSDMEKRMVELEEQIQAWKNHGRNLGSLGPVS